MNTGHHTLSHSQDGSGKFGAQVKIYTWYNQQLAYLLGKLKAAKTATARDRWAS